MLGSATKQDAIDLDQPQTIAIPGNGKHARDLEPQFSQAWQGLVHPRLVVVDGPQGNLGLHRQDPVQDGRGTLDHVEVESLCVDLQVNPRILHVAGHLIEHTGEGLDFDRFHGCLLEALRVPSGAVGTGGKKRVEVRSGKNVEIGGARSTAESISVSTPAGVASKGTVQEAEALRRGFEGDDLPVEPHLVPQGSRVASRVSSDVKDAIDVEPLEQRTQVAGERPRRRVPCDRQTHPAAGPLDDASDPFVGSHGAEAQCRWPAPARPLLTPAGSERPE
jgi:hypothetical protein